MNFFDIAAPLYEFLHPGAKKTFAITRDLVDFQKTDKVLDLGGGVGRVAKFFIDQVEEITIVDSSPGMIKQCQKKFGLKCVLGRAEKLPFPDNYFDKVIIIEAIHHFEDCQAAFKEIQRVLKLKGKIIIEELNPDRFFTKIFGKIENLLGMKNNFYSPEFLAQLVRGYQFKTELVNKDKIIYYLVGENQK